MACAVCGHFKKLHNTEEIEESPCKFKECKCREYDSGSYRCSLCGFETTDSAEMEGHKFKGWNEGSCRN